MAVRAVAANVGNAAGCPVAVVLTAVLAIARAASPAMVSAAAIEPPRRRKRDRHEHAGDGDCSGSKQISHESPLGMESRECHGLPDQSIGRTA